MASTELKGNCRVLLWKPSTNKPQSKAAQNQRLSVGLLAGEDTMGWKLSKSCPPQQCLQCQHQTGKPPMGSELPTKPWLPCWGARSQTDQYSKDNHGSWNTEANSRVDAEQHKHNPAQVSCGAEPKLKEANRNLSTDPNTSWSACRISREDNPINSKHFSPLAKLLRSTSTQQENWDLPRDLTEISSSVELCQKFRQVSGRSCKLTFLVSDSWKTTSLFTIFCCFSWHWKKLSP